MILDPLSFKSSKRVMIDQCGSILGVFWRYHFLAYVFFAVFFPPSTKEELTPVLATPPPATRNSSGSLASPNVGPPKPPRPPGGYPSAGARCSFVVGARCAYNTPFWLPKMEG